jgi:nucleotide-binding universal stress UspA family protein
VLSRRATAPVTVHLTGSRISAPFADAVVGPIERVVKASPHTAPASNDASAGRESEPSRRGTIICGVTDTAGAEAAVEVAVDLSARLDVRLILVAVGDGILDATGRPLESVTTHAAREGARRALQRILHRSPAPADVECRLEVGEPAIELSRLAREENADLVLIASARSRLFRGRIHAGAIDALRTACPCPVVVVPS